MAHWVSWLQRWRPHLNFIRIHYAWILFCSLLTFPIVYSYGNLSAVDALFFGCSGATESGLNTVDVNLLKTYQQAYIYVIPIITNLMFINAMVVPVRLYWFRQKLKEAGWHRRSRSTDTENRAGRKNVDDDEDVEPAVQDGTDIALTPTGKRAVSPVRGRRMPTITFDEDTPHPARFRVQAGSRSASDAIHDGDEVTPVPVSNEEDVDAIKPVSKSRSRDRRMKLTQFPTLEAVKSIEKAASSVFVLGGHATTAASGSASRARSISRSRGSSIHALSRQASVGRNSRFYNLTENDREILGGIEYRALKILLKFVFGYLIGLHVIGVVFLLPWIHNADAKYTDWLAQMGVGKTWWAFYSSQTMINNLGFTLTPDSMITFRDATWPMLVMTFLAFAGNTCYPILLRLIIWIASKLSPKNSQSRESLEFLLDHPRRCYTLLFPSHPTWILFGIIFALNFVDILLIIVLDLDNPAVNDLPMGPRILSALFQAASSRHTGTATLNLALVNPGVQFSLLTMMYIAVFPIAVSIRSSNPEEGRTVGVWADDNKLDESSGKAYLLAHMQNQLSFDLWYIFLGTFLICVSEADRIMDTSIPSFSVFAVLFEVTSAYGNVGLSLGGPSGSVSMSGHYAVFSKVVICAMMIRGRHRGLPYALDSAITLPDLGENEGTRLTDAQTEERSRDRRSR